MIAKMGSRPCRSRQPTRHFGALEEERIILERYENKKRSAEAEKLAQEKTKKKMLQMKMVQMAEKRQPLNVAMMVTDEERSDEDLHNIILELQFEWTEQLELSKEEPWPLGTTILKAFDGVLHHGRITAHILDDDGLILYYRVTYDDNDVEDLEHQEIHELLYK